MRLNWSLHENAVGRFLRNLRTVGISIGCFRFLLTDFLLGFRLCGIQEERTFFQCNLRFQLDSFCLRPLRRSGLDRFRRWRRLEFRRLDALSLQLLINTAEDTAALDIGRRASLLLAFSCFGDGRLSRRRIPERSCRFRRRRHFVDTLAVLL